MEGLGDQAQTDRHATHKGILGIGGTKVIHRVGVLVKSCVLTVGKALGELFAERLGLLALAAVFG